MKTILFPFFLLGCTANKQPEDTANDPDEEVLPDWLDISVELESTRTEYSLPALGAAVIQALPRNIECRCIWMEQCRCCRQGEDNWLWNHASFYSVF